AGNGVVVDARLLAGDALDDGDALVLRLVGEHRPFDDVADREYPRNTRLPAVVKDDPAALAVDRDARFLQPQPGGVRPTADGDEDAVGLELQRLPLAVGLDRHLLALYLRRRHLRLEMKGDALRLQRAV